MIIDRTMSPKQRHAILRDHYSSIDAFASARLVTLGDGAERGVRVVELRNSCGLEVEVIVDRGFDLGRLALDGCTVSWHSPGGYRAPWLIDQSTTQGQGFLTAMSGLLSTCGYDHIRQPQRDEVDHAPLSPYREAVFPLHGAGAHQPARLIGYGVDLDAEEPVLWCEGEVTQAMLFVGALRLKRRITVPLLQNCIRIDDVVENIGPNPQPVMMLYHVNLGYPLIDDETAINLNRGSRIWDNWSGKAGGFASSPAAEISVLKPDAGDRLARCTVRNPRNGLSFELIFDTSTLPYLQVLRLRNAGTKLVGIEPCTAAGRTRQDAREAGDLPFLEPGEARRFSLEFMLTNPSRRGA